LLRVRGANREAGADSGAAQGSDAAPAVEGAAAEDEAEDPPDPPVEAGEGAPVEAAGSEAPPEVGRPREAEQAGDARIDAVSIREGRGGGGGAVGGAQDAGVRREAGEAAGASGTGRGAPSASPPGSAGGGPVSASPVGGAGGAGSGAATRYCASCGARVPLAADGLHCREGHRLSPAHARRRFGLLRRR
jgi:hypothetical protein